MTARTGAVSELAVAQFLITEGYEVFRNVCASGPADIIAWNPSTDEIRVIDVKTADVYKRKSDGFRVVSYPKRRGKLERVEILAFDREANEIVNFGA